MKKYLIKFDKKHPEIEVNKEFLMWFIRHHSPQRDVAYHLNAVHKLEDGEQYTIDISNELITEN